MAIPIPNRPSGFTLGSNTSNAEAAVTLDVFFDIQCPHSRKFWSTLLALIEHYKDQPFRVTAHLITISNHRQAWDMSLALLAEAQGDSQRFFDFATFLFDRQDQFMNDQFKDKTNSDLQQLAASFSGEFSGEHNPAFLTRMNSHDIYIDARTPIRYAATRAVWATPTVLINNADDLPVRFDSSFE